MKQPGYGLAILAAAALAAACGDFQRGGGKPAAAFGDDAGAENGGSGGANAAEGSEEGAEGVGQGEDEGVEASAPVPCPDIACAPECQPVLDEHGCLQTCECPAEGPEGGPPPEGTEGGEGPEGHDVLEGTEGELVPPCAAATCPDFCDMAFDEHGCPIACDCPEEGFEGGEGLEGGPCPLHCEPFGSMVPGECACACFDFDEDPCGPAGRMNYETCQCDCQGFAQDLPGGGCECPIPELDPCAPTGQFNPTTCVCECLGESALTPDGRSCECTNVGVCGQVMPCPGQHGGPQCDIDACSQCEYNCVCPDEATGDFSLGCPLNTYQNCDQCGAVYDAVCVQGSWVCDAPPFLCSLICDYGYAQDAADCRSCECNKTPQPCRHGFGCQPGLRCDPDTMLCLGECGGPQKIPCKSEAFMCKRLGDTPDAFGVCIFLE